MQKERKQVKSMSSHGFSQFELTNKLLQNLNNYEITPTAKLVLLYLSSCYNPKKADMFPKQKTIAAKLGISEASVIRAISELHKQQLIVSERKYTNRYKWTSKIVSEASENEKIFNSDSLRVENTQKDSSQTCNLQPHDIEQTKEHKKEPIKVDDFKILKEYAENHKAKNVTTYINFLKKNGSADKIIANFKAKEASDKYFAKQIEETKKLVGQIKRDAKSASAPTKEWKDLKAKLMAL